MSGASSTTRFKASHSDDELLALLRDVSRQADPEAPDQVSQRAFDKARAPAGHSDCPSARQIASRLGRPWRELLDLVHHHWSDRSRRLGVSRSDRGRKGLSLEQCLGSIRQVARTLGRETINRTDYQTAVERIAATERRAWRHGNPGLLPSLAQVEVVLRQQRLDWDQACAKAGLNAPSTATHGLTPEQAVAAFAHETGSTPRSREQLRDWARARRVSLAHLSSTQLHAAVDTHNSNLKQSLPAAARDLAFPAPHSPTSPPVGRPRRNPNREWDQQALIAGMALAAGLLKPGEQLGQRQLNRIARENPDKPIPSYSTVERHIQQARTSGDKTAGWENWKAQALKKARR